MSNKVLFNFFLSVFCVFSAESNFLNTASAEDSNQPYIDQVKKELDQKASERGEEPESSNEVEPFIDHVKRKLEAHEPSSGQPEKGYTEQLKEANPGLRQEQTEESYTETEKPKLPPHEEGGAIQALTEGRSELHPKRVGTAHNAFGIRYGAALTRNLTAPAGVQLRNFNDVYGNNYAPDISLYYEFQPFHSEIFGNIGIIAIGGLAYYQGTGQFSYAIPMPGGGGNFPLTSSTKFQFFTAPVVVAADYRFNLMKYVKPFAMFGPAAIGYVENRNDGVSGNKGYSFGVFASGGASILMDWIFPGDAWDLYTSFGIQHYYLTVEFSNLSTFAGLVNANIYGITAGIMFEY